MTLAFPRWWTTASCQQPVGLRDMWVREKKTALLCILQLFTFDYVFITFFLNIIRIIIVIASCASCLRYGFLRISSRSVGPETVQQGSGLLVHRCHHLYSVSVTSPGYGVGHSPS